MANPILAALITFLVDFTKELDPNGYIIKYDFDAGCDENSPFLDPNDFFYINSNTHPHACPTKTETETETDETITETLTPSDTYTKTETETETETETVCDCAKITECNSPFLSDRYCAPYFPDGTYWDNVNKFVII